MHREPVGRACGKGDGRRVQDDGLARPRAETATEKRGRAPPLHRNELRWVAGGYKSYSRLYNMCAAERERGGVVHA